ncbi:uncharacterized protein LOC104581396 [Brachypodium distachyon]|uniref:uncharacterized protein LOC104581396 n=1 Tax=Brachypodium distachyon TaxID=15368 RepID=UPI00052FFA21|nr:uncharacterized protein LOC104581396 [Brachypodium distachyon]|eukprot:XP_010227195.1 uncharacterized protein LOC104581396 [Brachypodium distachyon]
MEENLERLEWAHSKLEFALERSSKLLITDVSLLHQRRAIKRVYCQFEWCADKADKFMSKVESGCTLAHYRFFSPLITQLLQVQNLEYVMKDKRIICILETKDTSRAEIRQQSRD